MRKRKLFTIAGSVLFFVLVFSGGIVLGMNVQNEPKPEPTESETEQGFFQPYGVGTEGRLTLELVEKIVAENDDFESICNELAKAQPYPDHAWDGDAAYHVEYWLNYDENDRIEISIIEPGNGTISHGVYNEEGQCIRYEALFRKLEKEYQPEKYQDSFQTYGTGHGYPYRDYIMGGGTESSEQRLTLEAAKRIVAENDDFKTICEELAKIQPYPDHIWEVDLNRGDIRTEYWMDYDEREQIVIVPHLEQIYHVVYAANNVLSSYEMIYGGRR